MDLNLSDLKRIADALEAHLALAKEDLAFRREQAAKSEAQQATIMNSMFGVGKAAGEKVGNAIAEVTNHAIDTVRASGMRRRPRHSAEPE